MSLDLEEPDSNRFCKSDWLSIDSCVPEGGARFCGNLSTSRNCELSTVIDVTLLKIMEFIQQSIFR